MHNAILLRQRTLFFGIAGTMSAATYMLPAKAIGAIGLPIFNTGVNNSGVALSSPGVSDPHWTIGGVPAMTAKDPNGGWIADQTSGPNQSAWIGSMTGAIPGTYTFIQSFFIPAGATNLSLSGRWVLDNDGKLFLNDYETLSARYDSTTDPTAIRFQQFKNFTLDDPSKLIPGSNNVLRAVITDGGPPYGFQAQFVGSYTAAVPGPLPIFGVADAFTTSRRLRQRITPLQCSK
jgi:hypothetical protein